LVGLLVLSGAFAGVTTGPAAGTNVEPSTAIHKQNSGGCFHCSSLSQNKFLLTISIPSRQTITILLSTQKDL
jgi:hypothetical protein